MELGLTEEQIQRYSRQILLREIGGEGQKRLLRSSAFIIGAGGLGSAALLYLAAAGVGRLGIADGETVDLTNLQRQIIHGTSDVGKNKAVSAKAAIQEINPDCEVQVFEERLTARNIQEMIRGYDVVLDGSDNFPTRFLVADTCWLEKIRLVSAAAIRFEGQLMTILPGEGNPCYRCLHPEPPPEEETPTCQQAGVFGAIVGVIGTLQALEALKLLLGVGHTLSHEVLVYDALRQRFVSGKRAPNPACPLCSAPPTISCQERGRQSILY
jgi:adenylyltransferase/sulfurtransferase